MPPQVAETARASGCGKPGRAGEPVHHVLEPDAREDRHAVPRRLAVSGDRVAAVCELVAEQLGERVVGELGLLQADDVRLALVEPRQQPRHPLLDRVHVPSRDSHRPNGSRLTHGRSAPRRPAAPPRRSPARRPSAPAASRRSAWRGAGPSPRPPSRGGGSGSRRPSRARPARRRSRRAPSSRTTRRRLSTDGARRRGST